MDYKDKLGTRLKDYLNRPEEEKMIWLAITHSRLMVDKQEFGQTGAITKDEHKYLSMVETYLDKFLTSYLGRLSTKDLQRLNKRIVNYDIRVMDRYTLNRVEGKLKDDLEVTHLTRDEFEDLCDGLLITHCNNCTKDHSECKLYDVFMNNFVPDAGYNLPNCIFAYKVNKDINDK